MPYRRCSMSTMYISRGRCPIIKVCFSSASSASISITFNISSTFLTTFTTLNFTFNFTFNFNFPKTLTFNSNTNTFAMAATKITTSAPSFPVPYGRSGYNKYVLLPQPTPCSTPTNNHLRDGDDEEEDKCVNQGRSGYNGYVFSIYTYSLSTKLT